MKMFNLEALHNLVKKVVNEKLIEEYAYAFIGSRDTHTHFHFLSYGEIPPCTQKYLLSINAARGNWQNIYRNLS